jgi:hypothetical protein
MDRYAAYRMPTNRKHKRLHPAPDPTWGLGLWTGAMPLCFLPRPRLRAASVARCAASPRSLRRVVAPCLLAGGAASNLSRLLFAILEPLLCMRVYSWWSEREFGKALMSPKSRSAKRRNRALGLNLVAVSSEIVVLK